MSWNSNFLYNPDLKEGVLVDFGLAEVGLHRHFEVLLQLSSINTDTLLLLSCSTAPRFRVQLFMSLYPPNLRSSQPYTV